MLGHALATDQNPPPVTPLRSKSEQVLSLEHRRHALELGMAERRSEVGLQTELMAGEARLLREDLARVGRELRHAGRGRGCAAAAASCCR